MMPAALFSLLLSAAVGVSLFQGTPEELREDFHRAQKLMVGGDFQASIALYQQVIAAQGNRLMRPERVRVGIGEDTLVVRAAAQYQVASSLRRRGRELKDAAPDSADSAGVPELRAAAAAYACLAQDTLASAALRTRAAYQVAQCCFTAGLYRQAIGAYRQFEERFPESRFAADARYRRAWAHYRLDEWHAAARLFVAVAGEEPGSDRSNRALFQAGKCHEHMESWPEALKWYRRLAAQFDPSPYAGKRRVEDVMRALRENLSETERELIAKAHIKVGDAYRRLDSLDAAVAWYEHAAERFPTEEELVRTARLRTAETWAEQDRIEQALDAYRRAMEETEDLSFRARVQVQYAQLAHTARRYAEAAEVYGAYGGMFAGQADEAGLSVAEARLLRAECLRLAAGDTRPPSRGGAKASATGERRPTGPTAADTTAVVRQVTVMRRDTPAVGTAAVQDTVADGSAARRSAARPRTGPSARWDARHSAAGTRRDSLLRTALAEYRSLARDTRADTVAAEAMLGAGICLAELDSVAAARAALERTRLRYPHARGGRWAGLKLARMQADAKDMDGAIRAYRALLKVAAGEIADAARVELGLILATRGRTDAAIELLSAVRAESEEYGRARLALARVHGERQEWERSAAILQSALEQGASPGMRGEMVQALAALSFQRGDYTGTLAHLSAVDTTRLSASSRTDYLYMRGACRYQTGDYAGALADLRRYATAPAGGAMAPDIVELLAFSVLQVHDLDAGLQLYRRWMAAAATAPEQEKLALGMGWLQYRAGATAECAEWLAAQQFTAPDLRARADLLRGEALVSAAAWTQAYAVLTDINANRLKPADARRRLYLAGAAAMNAGRYEDALKHLSALLQSGPETATAREAKLLLARSLFALGRHERAASAFLQYAVRYAGRDDASRAAYLAGENLYLLEEYERAVAAYARVQEGEWRPRALLAIAWCYVEMGREKEALRHVEQLQEAYPQSAQAPEAAMLAGDYYYNTQDYAAARQAYEQVVAWYPESSEAATARDLLVELADLEADVLYQAAMATFDLGQYEEAAELLQAVIRRYPDTLSEMAARCNLGAAYERQGKWHQAVQVYDGVMTAAVDVPEYQQMRDFAQDHREWIRDYRM